jgi:hypothetical protein
MAFEIGPVDDTVETKVKGNVLGQVFGNTAHAGIFHGAGTSSSTYSTATAGNFQSYYQTCTAASGTVRGIYNRIYLTGGAGGEAARLYTTVSSDTPADTVNGAHCSLSFGSSAGNITGAGNAVRATLHVPSRSLTGTTSAVNAELYADGASSTSGGLMGCIRATLGGNATGAALLDDTANLIVLDGGANGSGNICSAAGNEPTWTSATHKIRCSVNGTTMYLVAVLA